MRVITLAGWGQPHDALSVLCPEAEHVDYASHADAGSALAHIAERGQGSDTVIGWSLGGQLAVRAIAAGMLRPEKLVLIATPYQFVETPALPVGMKRDLYDKFRHNYASNPKRTLAKAWELIHKDDSKADDVRGHMDRHDKDRVLSRDWLAWLDALNDYSCEGLNLSGFPPTLLVHGGRDIVVAPQQSQCFARHLPQAELMMIGECGHAPHWHDTQALARKIRERTHV